MNAAGRPTLESTETGGTEIAQTARFGYGRYVSPSSPVPCRATFMYSVRSAVPRDDISVPPTAAATDRRDPAGASAACRVPAGRVCKPDQMCGPGREQPG